MNKNLLIVGMTIILVAVGFNGCIQEDALSQLGYANREYGFGLNPPEGWTANESFSNSSVVMFENPSGEYGESLLVSVPVLYETGKTLCAIAESVVDYYSNLFSNFTLISMRERTVNGMNAYEFIYTFNETFIEDFYLFSLPVKRKQILIEKNKEKVYILTYKATPDSYDEFESVVEQSISSFTII